MWVERSRTSRVLVAATLSVCLIVLTHAGSVRGAFPGDDGQIAFTSDRDVAAGEIYGIAPGSPASRITFSNGSSDPAYSPDGGRIAFVSLDNQIFVINANGSGRNQITATSTAKQDPAWSPDGTQIAYVANSVDLDGQTDLEIWAINADGSGRRQLTHNSFPDTQPAWSPVGDRIAFVSARTGDTDRNVYVMDADGGNQANLTPNSPAGCSPNCYQGHDDNPAWSPSGSTIAYVHGHTIAGGGRPDIWTMGPTGGSKTNLSNNDSTSDLEPAWSPDGSRIAYRGIAADNNHNIYVMNADGTGQGPIDVNPAKDEQPDWQPVPVCTMTVSAENDPLLGTSGNDVLCGDNRDNTINGGRGNDMILGGRANDSLTGGLGNDTVDGGSGTDAALYPGASAVRASLATGFATGVGSDVLLSVEDLTGSRARRPAHRLSSPERLDRSPGGRFASRPRRCGYAQLQGRCGRQRHRQRGRRDRHVHHGPHGGRNQQLPVAREWRREAGGYARRDPNRETERDPPTCRCRDGGGGLRRSRRDPGWRRHGPGAADADRRRARTPEDDCAGPRKRRPLARHVRAPARQHAGGPRGPEVGDAWSGRAEQRTLLSLNSEQIIAGEYLHTLNRTSADHDRVRGKPVARPDPQPQFQVEAERSRPAWCPDSWSTARSRSTGSPR